MNNRNQVILAGICTLLCLCFTWIGQSFVAHNQYNDYDSSYFIYGGKYLLEGGVLYHEFWDQKPPGIFWVNALLIKLFGINFKGYALVGGGLFLGLLAVSAVVLRHQFSFFYLCLYLVIFSFAFNLNNYMDYGNRPEFYMSILDGLSFLCIFSFSHTKKKLLLYSCGFFAACASCFKPVGMAAFLAAGAWLVLIFRLQVLRYLLALILGFVTPLFAVGLILLTQGNLYECIQATLIVPLQLSSSHKTLWEAIVWAFKCYGPIWGVMLPLLGLPFILMSKEMSSKDRSTTLLLLLYAFASLSGVIIQRNGEPHYFLQGVGPIILIAVFSLSRSVQLLSNKTIQKVVLLAFMIFFCVFARWPALRQVQRYQGLEAYEKDQKEVLDLCNWLDKNIPQGETFYYLSNGYQPYIWTSFKPAHRYSSHYLYYGEVGANIFLEDLQTLKNTEEVKAVVENVLIENRFISLTDYNKGVFEKYKEWLSKEFIPVKWTSSKYKIYIRKSKGLIY